MLWLCCVLVGVGATTSIANLTAVPQSWLVPIQVNVFLLGLDGTGHLGVNIPQDRLQHWLVQLASNVPEQVILEGKEKDSPVVYKYNYRLVPLASDVLSVVERLLECNFRKDGEELQVNPRLLAALFEDLIDYLGLSSSFNLFVLNPHKGWTKGPNHSRYGYRDGLSNEEAKLVAMNPELRRLKSPRTKASYSKRLTKDRTSISDALDRSRQWAEGQALHCPPPGLQRVEELLHTSQDRQPPENCLLDTWLGVRRVGFIDLAAGPFEWGPVIGGEGLRTTASLPNVSTFVANVTESQEQPVDVKPRFDWEAIEAEKSMVEAFIAAECRGEPSPQCEEMQRKLREINDFMSRAQPVDEASERDFEHANAFSFLTHKLGKALHSDSLIQYQFLAHLSATISSLHHLLTPPLKSSITTAYAERVIFHVYILRNHNQDAGLGNLIQQLEEALMAMKLPLQTFTFAVRMLNVDDDPRLALAFATSLRSTVIPTLTEQGLFEANPRLYLHSRSLQYELTRIDDQEDAQPDNDHHGEGAREIPIFIFSLHDAYLPILVDRHFQSQVVGELVVATHSPLTKWRSDLMCNGKPIYWDLSNPVKAIVQSALQVLAGVPFEESKDWKWSVGSHACAITAAGVEVSDVHVDIIRRSYATSAIRFAHQQLEAIRAQLLHIPLDRATKLWDFVQARDATLGQLYKHVQQNLTTLASCVANDVDCLDLISPFIDSVKSLGALSPRLFEGEEMTQCAVSKPPSPISLVWYLAFASLCVATCLRVSFMGSAKLKINRD